MTKTSLPDPRTFAFASDDRVWDLRLLWNGDAAFLACNIKPSIDGGEVVHVAQLEDQPAKVYTDTEELRTGGTFEDAVEWALSR